MADVTITVDRADLDWVLDISEGYTFAADRIRAAIPEPTWEPSEAMVKAYLKAFASNAAVARHTLIALHDAGFDLTLREGHDG